MRSSVMHAIVPTFQTQSLQKLRNKNQNKKTNNNNYKITCTAAVQISAQSPLLEPESAGHPTFEVGQVRKSNL